MLEGPINNNNKKQEPIDPEKRLKELKSIKKELEPYYKGKTAESELSEEALSFLHSGADVDFEIKKELHILELETFHEKDQAALEENISNIENRIKNIGSRLEEIKIKIEDLEKEYDRLDGTGITITTSKISDELKDLEKEKEELIKEKEELIKEKERLEKYRL